MAKKEEYEQRAEKLLEPLMAENNFELVDVEYVKEAGNWYLRAYIDKPGGITVDDCELVSRAFSDLLDVHDFISEAYILEVSSPGLGRQLKKEKDFARSIGEDVELKLYKALEIQNDAAAMGAILKQKELTGVLKEFDKDTVTIGLEDEKVLVIPRKEIAMIRLALDF